MADFDPFSSGAAIEQKGEDFDPFTSGAATALDDPKQEHASPWKPLYSGLDQAPPNPDQAGALDYLGRTINPDKETRAQAINQSYVQSKMPDWQTNMLQQNWPTVRDQFAKESGFTQGEPVTDAALYTKISASLDDEQKEHEIQNEILPSARTGLERAAILQMKLPHLTWWQEINNGVLKLPEAPSLPDLPQLGINNPAIVGGVYNSVVKPGIEGLTSPLGLATLGLGSAAAEGVPLAKKALGGISGLFSGMMAWAAGEKAPKLIDTLNDPKASTQQKVEAVGGPVGNLMLSLTAGMHAVTELSPNPGKIVAEVEGKNPEEAATVLRQEANTSTDPQYVEALNDTAEKLEKLPVPVKPEAQAETPAQGEPASQPTAPEAEPASTESPAGEENPATAKEEPPAAIPEPASVDEIQKQYSIKNAAVEKDMKAMGEEPPSESEKVSDELAMQKAGEALRENPEVGAELVDRLSGEKNPRVSHDDIMLLQHEYARLSIERDRLEDARDEAVKLGDPEEIQTANERVEDAKQDISNTADILKVVGAEQGRAFRARQLFIRQDYSLGNVERQYAEAKGSELTPEEASHAKETSQKLIEAEKRATDAEKALADARSEIAESAKARKSTKGKPPSKLSVAADAARERLKAAYSEGRVSSGLDPTLLKDHAIVAADYIAKGVTKLADLTEAMVRDFGDKVLPYMKEIRDEAMKLAGQDTEEKRQTTNLKATKTRDAKAIAELERRINEKDYTPAEKKRITQLDEEARAQKVVKQRLSQKYQTELAAHVEANRTAFQKTMDQIGGGAKAAALSGYHTLGKLFDYDVAKIAEFPATEALGAIIRRTPGFRDISSRANMEMGAEAQSIGKFYAKLATDGMREAYQTVKNRKSDLKAELGDAEHTEKPFHWYDYPGLLHEIEKSPLRTADFNARLEKGYAQAYANGHDITDPFVQGAIRKEAFDYANRAILQEDNSLAKLINQGIGNLEKADPDSPIASANKKALATLLKTFVTKGIVRTPLNHIMQTLEASPLGLAKGLKDAAQANQVIRANGIEALSSKEANTIARLLKVGALGSAMFVWGVIDSTKKPKDRLFGGFYTPEEKRDEKDAKAGRVRIGGHNLVIPNPLTMSAQLGSTFGRVAFSKTKQGTKGVTEATVASILALGSSAPIANPVVNTAQKVVYGHGEEAAWDEVAGLVPALAQNIAQDTDSNVKRKPHNVGQAVEMNIPGLREKVPVKKK